MNKQPAAQVYQQIKQDIRDGQLPIGEALKQTELSERYGVSRMPIRDILRRLQAEGWLCPVGKRGLMIPALNAAEAEDLYLMRMHLEPLLLGFAVPFINNQHLGFAEDILKCIDESPHLTLDEHGQYNSHFHLSLYTPANRPTLCASVESLHQQCARYIGYHNQTLQYVAISQQEHYEMIDMLRRNNTSAAQKMLKHHIRDAGKLLVEYLRAQK